MEWRDHFDDKGYAVLSALLNESQIADIVAAVNPVFGQWFDTNQTKITRHGMVNMHSLTHPSHFDDGVSRVGFFNAISPTALVNAVQQMFGNELYFHNTQLFFNPLDKTKLPYWHRDMQYNPIEDSLLREEQKNMLSLHLRIPLFDERGVELIPGSHKRWDTQTERKVRLELGGHKNTESLPGAELIQLKVGDVLVFDSQMIHRGNYALNHERRALDLCVGKYHRLMASGLDVNILPTLTELSEIKNKDWFNTAYQLLQTNHLSGKLGG